MLNRRVLLIAPLGSPLIGPLSRPAAAAALPLLDPQLAAAMELRYTVDARVYLCSPQAAPPDYEPGRHCGSCDLYRGAPAASHGPCRMFRRHRVAAIGWCQGFEEAPGAPPLVI